MQKTRIYIFFIGIILPYMARLPGGVTWLQQYTDTSISGFLLLQLFNSITWGSILILSNFYKRSEVLLIPVMFGFGFSAISHYSIDLAADAQASLALIFIPIFSIVPVAIGGGIGLLIEWLLKRNKI